MNKKSLLAIIFLFGATATQAQASWYCETDCGYVTSRDIGGAFSYHLVPVYVGSRVFGEGSTIGSAFNAMKSTCDNLLHDGFDVYNPNAFIKLNLRVSPLKVCKEI